MENDVVVKQGRSDGVGYIDIPPNQSTLTFFMWLFCLLSLLAMTS